MIKAIEIIVVFTLLIFSFFAGVKYSESVKSHASWLFENKSDEVELPDLSSENGSDMDAPVNENGEVLNNGVQIAPQDGATIPAENSAQVPANTAPQAQVPAATPSTAPRQ
jgi:hypothetical protein